LNDKILKTIENILLKKKKNRETITYSELAEYVTSSPHLNAGLCFARLHSNLPASSWDEIFSIKGKSFSKEISIYLHKLCETSYKQNGYMIGSIVVRKDKGYPSDGFFKFAEKLFEIKLRNQKDKINFWENQLKKIFGEIN